MPICQLYKLPNGMAPPTLRLVLKQVYRYGIRQLWSISRHVVFNERELSILSLTNIKYTTP
jgi:hypothetical protein